MIRSKVFYFRSAIIVSFLCIFYIFIVSPFIGLITPNTTLDISVDLTKKGEILKTTINVNRDDVFGFFIEIRLSREESKMMENLYKETGNLDEYINRRNIGDEAIIPIRLKVIDRNSQKGLIVFETQVNTEKLDGYSSSRAVKRIEYTKLKKGKYEIQLESLQENPGLSGVGISFDMRSVVR